MLGTIRAAGLVGRVGLVLTALRTGPDRDTVEAAVAELARTVLFCEPLLCSGGHLVVVARPRRHPNGSLVDLTTSLIAVGTSAGLVPVDRCIALTAGLRGSHVVTRASLAERRATGGLTALIAHHEVLIFQLAHDSELATVATADISWPTDNNVQHSGGRRAA